MRRVSALALRGCIPRIRYSASPSEQQETFDYVRTHSLLLVVHGASPLADFCCCLRRLRCWTRKFLCNAIHGKPLHGESLSEVNAATLPRLQRTVKSLNKKQSCINSCSWMCRSPSSSPQLISHHRCQHTWDALVARVHNALIMFDSHSNLGHLEFVLSVFIVSVHPSQRTGKRVNW